MFVCTEELSTDVDDPEFVDVASCLGRVLGLIWLVISVSEYIGRPKAHPYVMVVV